jgi:DNA repair protein RadC
MREPGVGAALASRLASAFELGRRAGADGEGDERPAHHAPPRSVGVDARSGPSEKGAPDRSLPRPQNGLIHRETISIGSLNTTRTHPREILYPAIAHLALGFILVHNHPSGSLDPSDEDVAFTRGVHRAAETIGIELYDHIIVAKAGFTSLRERGTF